MNIFLRAIIYLAHLGLYVNNWCGSHRWVPLGSAFEKEFDNQHKECSQLTVSSSSTFRKCLILPDSPKPITEPGRWIKRWPSAQHETPLNQQSLCQSSPLNWLVLALPINSSSFYLSLPTYFSPLPFVLHGVTPMNLDLPIWTWHLLLRECKLSQLILKVV